MSIERLDEIGLIKPSLNLDPSKLQAYAAWLAKFWPEADFAALNRTAETAATWPAQAAGE